MTTSGIGRRRKAAQEGTTNTSYQRRRQEIIAAAGHVFKSKGYQGASLGDIADHLGTDRANLYYYVASKEELFEEAVTEAVMANAEHARQLRASDLPTPEKIKRLVIDLMVSYEEHFPFIYVFIQENLNHVAEGRSAWARQMKQVNHDYESIVIGMIEDGHADGSLRNTTPAWVVAYGIIGLVGWTNRWYDPHRKRDGIDAEAIGTAYAELVVSGIVA